MPPEFANRDPRSPGFWDERFDGAFTPWDRGAVPERLAAFLQTGNSGSDPRVRPVAGDGRLPGVRPLGLTPPSRFQVLIPGCGAAYELEAFIQSGWNATAIDFSPSAVAAARQIAPQLATHIQLADFFTYEPAQPLDVIYERAFLCAMPRDMWPQVARRWAELLPEGALLLGYFFFDNNPKGPPFGAGRSELEQLLSTHFTLEQDEAVADSIPVFEGKERWMAWRRKKAL